MPISSLLCEQTFFVVIKKFYKEYHFRNIFLYILIDTFRVNP